MAAVRGPDLAPALAASIMAVRVARALESIRLRLAEHSAYEAITGCLLWTSFQDAKGYGRLHVNGRPELAHRLSWLLHRGDPGTLWVLHRCDTPACINPDHLFLGTHKDNMRDMVAKGRSGGNPKVDVCKRGHLMSGENLYIDPSGDRVCRGCSRERTRRYRLTRRDAENARARELYRLNLEENRRRGREKQRRYARARNPEG